MCEVRDIGEFKAVVWCDNVECSVRKQPATLRAGQVLDEIPSGHRALTFDCSDPDEQDKFLRAAFAEELAYQLCVTQQLLSRIVNTPSHVTSEETREQLDTIDRVLELVRYF